VKFSLAFLLACLTLVRPGFAQKEVTPDRIPFPQIDDRFEVILQNRSPTRTAAPRIDPARLQAEAKELFELSQSLQPDMQFIHKGLLPKDTVEKLKRIEKLSKHLRGELAQ